MSSPTCHNVLFTIQFYYQSILPLMSNQAYLHQHQNCEKMASDKQLLRSNEAVW